MTSFEKKKKIKITFELWINSITFFYWNVGLRVISSYYRNIACDTDYRYLKTRLVPLWISYQCEKKITIFISIYGYLLNLLFRLLYAFLMHDTRCLCQIYVKSNLNWLHSRAALVSSLCIAPEIMQTQNKAFAVERV